MALYLKGHVTHACVSAFLITHYGISLFVLAAQKMTLIFFILSINRLVTFGDGEKIDSMWTEWANFYDQKHLLNNHQQLFFLSFFFCFACKEKEGWCSFFAPTSSTLICYNAELHSRLTIWSTGRIHSGPLACELVARYQYRWSSSLSFLPLPISGKEKIEVKALQRFFF